MEKLSKFGFVFVLSSFSCFANATMGPGMAPEQAAALAQFRHDAHIDESKQVFEADNQTTLKQPHLAHLKPRFGEQYGPVHNETLWNISRKLVKNTPYTIKQGVNAIVAHNKEVFPSGQFQIMRDGVILKIPNESDMKINSDNLQSANETDTAAQLN